MGMIPKILLFVLAGVLLLSGAALAATITTSVRFIIPTSTAFSISTPSDNSTFVTGFTPTIFFNTTSTTITMVNGSISDTNGSMQTNITSILRYRNDGNVRINITMRFGSITAACINVKASVGSLGWESTCTSLTGPTTNTTCVNWNSTSTGAKNVTNDLAVNAARNVWLWADFTSCSTGLDETQTITHESLV